MSVLAQLLFPVEARTAPPAPPAGQAVELAARAHAAAVVGDRAAGARVVADMLADGWWGPLVEAAAAGGGQGADGPVTTPSRSTAAIQASRVGLVVLAAAAMAALVAAVWWTARWPCGWGRLRRLSS